MHNEKFSIKLKSLETFALFSITVMADVMLLRQKKGEALKHPNHAREQTNLVFHI